MWSELWTFVGRLSWELLGRQALSGFIPSMVSVQRARRGGGLAGPQPHGGTDSPSPWDLLGDMLGRREVDGWPVISDSWPALCLPLGASVSCEVDVKSHGRMTGTVGLTTKGTPEPVGVQRMWQVTKGSWESCVRPRGRACMMNQLQRGGRMPGDFTSFQWGRPDGMGGSWYSPAIDLGQATFGGPVSSLQNVGSY